MPEKRCKISCKNLGLLITKNVNIHFAHPLGTAVILLYPVIFFLLSQINFVFYPSQPEIIPARKFPRLELNNTNISSIYYSPRGDVFTRIMDDIARSLDTRVVRSYPYAADLESALVADDGFVGIEFEDKLGGSRSLPKDFTMSLRFPRNFRNIPLSYNQPSWIRDAFVRTRTKKHLSDAYMKEGFLLVEAALYQALLNELEYNYDYYLVHMRPFYEPERKDYSYLRRLYKYLLAFFAIMYLGPCLVSSHIIISEKMRMWSEMRILGLSTTMHWFSWFVVEYLLFNIPMIVILALMKLTICPTSDVTLLIFICFNYIFAVICFVFMVVAFSSTILMSLIVILSLNIMSSMPYLMFGCRNEMKQSMLICLFLNSAMPCLLQEILSKEISQQGLTWLNLFYSSRPGHYINVGIILLLMNAANILQILCALYVDRIHREGKWNYPCQRKFWCPWDRPGRRTTGGEEYVTDPIDRSSSSNLELMPRMRVLLEAKHLYKTYNDKNIVEDINLKFYEDEITVFIGQNGAGKTVLFSMLAGIISPTYGQVLIDGNDLYRSHRKDRNIVSFSHQHETFFNELSAYWHIVFYSRLKGLPRKEAEDEADKYLKIMDMEDFAALKVDYLPPEMKQKLSICCALCADTKVVICDQPTLSLDPLGRREMWDILRNEKTGRTILVSTHFLENTELFADRFAVMRDGALYCYGTSDAIITSEGPGYRLVCVCLENCDVAKVTKFLKHLIPDVVLEKQIESEVTYRLAVDDIEKFTDLFLALESQLVELKLDSFGVHAPTLSETFLHIVSKHENPDMTDLARDSLTRDWVTRFREKSERSKCEVYCNVWSGLMLKKLLHTRHHIFLYIWIVCMPLLMLLIYLVTDRLNTTSSNVVDIDLLDFSVFPGGVAIRCKYEKIGEAHITGEWREAMRIGEIYGDFVRKRGGKIVDISRREDLGDFVLKNLKLLEEGNTKTYVAGITTFAKAMVAWYNRRLVHAPALSMGLAYNAIIKHRFDRNIILRNKPRDDTVGIEHMQNLESEQLQLMCFLFFLGYALSPFILLPVMESSTGMRHFQAMTKADMFTYWMAHLVFDYCIYIVIMIVSMVSFYYKTFYFLCWLALVLVIFGFSALSFVYLLSLPFKSVVCAIVCAVAINWFCVFASQVLWWQKHFIVDIISYVLMIVPFYALHITLETLFLAANEIESCDRMDRKYYCYHYLVCCEYEAERFYLGLYYLGASAVIMFFLLIIISWSIIHRNTICCRKKKLGIKFCTHREHEEKIVRVRQEIDELIKNKEELRTPGLVVSRVSKAFRDYVAVNCVSLKVNPYECFGLLGLNGSGKTTLVKAIIGMVQLDAGDIFVKGTNVRWGSNRYLRRIGYCTEESEMLTFMTGRQMLKFFCLISGVKKQRMSDIIDKLARTFMITKHLDKQIHYYSDGTKKKLDIAMAILSPTLIVLDNPTKGLDFKARQQIFSTIDYMRSLGRAILVTSPNMQECETFCTCLAIMVKGSLRCYGSVQQLKHRYDTGILIGIQLLGRDELRTWSNKVEEVEEEERQSHVVVTIEEQNSLEPSLENKSSTITNPLDENEKATQVYLKKKPFVPAYRQSTLVFTTKISDSWDYRTGDFKAEYSKMIKLVAETLKADFPESFILDRYVERGYVTIAIPNMEFKWSAMFSYLEKHRKFLQIKYYSISETTLEDVFLDLAYDDIQEK